MEFRILAKAFQIACQRVVDEDDASRPAEVPLALDGWMAFFWERANGNLVRAVAFACNEVQRLTGNTAEYWLHVFKEQAKAALIQERPMAVLRPQGLDRDTVALEIYLKMLEAFLFQGWNLKEEEQTNIKQNLVKQSHRLADLFMGECDGKIDREPAPTDPQNKRDEFADDFIDLMSAIEGFERTLDDKVETRLAVTELYDKYFGARQ